MHFWQLSKKRVLFVRSLPATTLGFHPFSTCCSAALGSICCHLLSWETLLLETKLPQLCKAPTSAGDLEPCLHLGERAQAALRPTVTLGHVYVTAA